MAKRSGENNFYNKVIFTVVLLAIFLAVGFTIYDRIETRLGTKKPEIIQEVQEKQPPIVKKLTLLAVGDIMMHQAQLDAAYDKKNNTYDFSNFFENINPYLRDGDIVYANLETPIAGEKLKYSGYPKFNAPKDILSELKNNFFTHVSLANNHALDRGWSGLENTIKNVEDSGLIGFGARLITASSTVPNYQITEKNGLKIGFLSYTYDTNGLTLPKNKVGMLSYINKEQIVKDIEELKSQKVDVIITALHFGIEYKKEENASQRELAQLACDSGSNIILGDHPHVLQPIVYLNATSSDRKCLAIYSLGNFMSGMTNIYTDLGGILKVDIAKTENMAPDGSMADSSLSMKPDFLATWVKRLTNKDGSKYYTVLPLDADKIPEDIKVTDSERKRLDIYRDFVETKIKGDY
jgi:poly-gamma-glutamate capsule biosynthesis protein CapA/YwtB (metallophosphatase superfamily)